MTNVFSSSLALASDQATQATAGGSLLSLLPMVAIFLIFYFLLIRPQVKKQKEQSAMVNALTRGDKVIAAGGIVGIISKIEDNVVFLDIGSDIKLQVVKSTITDNLNKAAEVKQTSITHTKKNKK